jgi:hypothetical protein
VVRTETYSWVSSGTLMSPGIGILLLVAFVAHQRRTSAPALDLDLFGIVNLRWGNLTMLAFGIAFSAMFLGRSCS